MSVQAAVVEQISGLVPPLGLAPDERRPLALLLRAKGATQTTTARALHVSKATVSRDLKYCRSHPLPVPSVGNAAELIGWHVECCQEVRRLAYDELAQLNLDPLASGSEGSLARLICLRVIVHAERLLLFGLEAAGLLPATWRSLRRRRRRRKGAAGRPLPTPHPYPERGR